MIYVNLSAARLLRACFFFVILSFFVKNLVLKDQILHFVQDDKEILNELSE